MKKQVVLMHMSGAYEHQNFYQQERLREMHLMQGAKTALGDADAKVDIVEVNCRDIEGVNCYCDDFAKEGLRQRIEHLSYEGIHFLDSGNYHYLSLLWIEKIARPFSLVVFDHHPDMQAPSFGEITSCGGWVKEALDTLPHLQNVYLLGVDQKLFEQLQIQDDRVYIGQDAWNATEEEKLPLYISFDKDLLGPEDCLCDWDQGEVTLAESIQWLDAIKKEHDILGMDVCGEDSKWEQLDGTSFEETMRINDKTNLALLRWYLAEMPETGV